MRILEIAGSGTIGTSSAGPISTVITKLANEFAGRGHTVTVADRAAAGERDRLDPRVRIRHLPVPSAKGRFGLKTPLDPLLQARSDLGFLKGHTDQQYDLIHVHDGSHILALPPLGHCRSLWTAHGLNWTMEPPGRPLAFRPRYRYLQWLDRLACRRASHVVVLNHQTRDALSLANVSVIPNGIDLDDWPPLERRGARACLGIPEDEFLITYVGRVAPEKGVDVFVRAIEMVSRQIPVKADAIGSLSGHFGSSTRVTEYAARVQNASPDTRFRGFIHRDEPEYRLRLAAADAVVIPSLTEPFGLVVLEALACGARVIGSDVGGVRDTLAHDVGRLVPPGDAQALAASIVGVYESGAEARCSVYGRKALKKFRWANIAEQYLTIMEALLGPREHEDA